MIKQKNVNNTYRRRSSDLSVLALKKIKKKRPFTEILKLADITIITQYVLILLNLQDHPVKVGKNVWWRVEEKLKSDKNYTLTSSGVIGLVELHNQI